MRPLWPLIVLIVPLCIAESCHMFQQLHPYVGASLLALAVLFVLLFAVAYFYFAVKSPDRLQSETYLLDRRRLDVIDAKGMPAPLPASAYKLLANPNSQDTRRKLLAESNRTTSPVVTITDADEKGV